MTKLGFRLFLAACTVCLVSLIPCNGPTLAVEGENPYGKLDAAVVKKVEWELRTLARKLAEQGKTDKETVFGLLANHLWKNPEIYGAAFAFAPELKNGKEAKSAPYLYRNGDQLIQRDLSADYDYTAPEQKWYAKPVKLGKSVWSEPCFNQRGKAWMVTYSIPIFSGGKEHQLIGVVTSDVLLPVAQ